MLQRLTVLEADLAGSDLRSTHHPLLILPWLGNHGEEEQLANGLSMEQFAVEARRPGKGSFKGKALIGQ